MITTHYKCHWCGAELIRKPQAKPVNFHFCNNVCKGEHQKTLRPVTPQWLYEHYVVKGLDTTVIGRMVGRDPKSVWNWLKGSGIPTRGRGTTGNGPRGRPPGFRHTPETRARLSAIARAAGRVPYDPAVGSYMKGRKGADCPNWRGGITPERQALYASSEWRAAAREAKARDRGACRRCGLEKRRGGPSFDLHHVVPFECVELRAVASNLVYLCEPCHYWAHGADNVNREFIKEVSQ